MRARKSGPKSFIGRFKLPHLNARGFSLMEVMVTVGILGVVAIGSSVLFSDMFAVQKRANINVILQNQRNEIISALTRSDTAVVGPGVQYSSAWARMVGTSSSTVNPGLNCLKTNTACQHGGAEVLDIYDNGGREIFFSRNATRGIRPDGSLCSTFSVASPDPTCPLRWDVEAEFQCVVNGSLKTECENPTIRFTGTLSYSPGSNPAFGTGFNTEAYRFSVRRGDKPDLNMPIKFWYNLPGTVGEGGCKHATLWTQRQLNTEEDPGNNATLSSNQFELAVGGYDCRVQAPAFKNGTNQIRLRGGGTGLTFTSAPAVASLQGGAIILTLQATFILNAPTTFVVEQKCSDQPTDGSTPSTAPNTWSLGVPAKSDTAPTGYESVIYTIVNCVKTS